MAKIPAFCDHCGARFYIENFIGGSGAKNISLKGNSTKCPVCGEGAHIVDGVFDLQDNVLILVDGPPITLAMMAQLKKVINKAKHEVTELDEIIAEVADISPDLAKKIRKRGLGPAAIVLVLILILRSCHVEVSVDLNELIDQAQGAERSGQTEEILNAPLPNLPEEPSEPERPNLVATQKGQPNRQARRRERSLARKRARRGPKPA